MLNTKKIIKKKWSLGMLFATSYTEGDPKICQS